MKKFFCLLISLIFVLSMAVPAFAEESTTELEIDPGIVDAGDFYPFNGFTVYTSTRSYTTMFARRFFNGTSLYYVAWCNSPFYYKNGSLYAVEGSITYLEFSSYDECFAFCFNYPNVYLVDYADTLKTKSNIKETSYSIDNISILYFSNHTIYSDKFMSGTYQDARYPLNGTYDSEFGDPGLFVPDEDGYSFADKIAKFFIDIKTWLLEDLPFKIKTSFGIGVIDPETGLTWYDPIIIFFKEIGSYISSDPSDQFSAMRDNIDSIIKQNNFLNFIVGFGSRFKNLSAASGPPVLKLDLSAKESPYGYSYGNGSPDLVSFSWYSRFKQYGDPLISAFLWIGYLFLLYKQLPNIIAGGAMITDNFNTYENRMYSKSIREGGESKGGKSRD